jgi:ABC-type iron transport system FetAB permease component
MYIIIIYIIIITIFKIFQNSKWRQEYTTSRINKIWRKKLLNRIYELVRQEEKFGPEKDLLWRRGRIFFKIQNGNKNTLQSGLIKYGGTKLLNRTYELVRQEEMCGPEKDLLWRRGRTILLLVVVLLLTSSIDSNGCTYPLNYVGIRMPGSCFLYHSSSSRMCLIFRD